MFLQPLTLLDSLSRCCCLSPATARALINFFPRYRSARVLVEVSLEGIPQTVPLYGNMCRASST